MRIQQHDSETQQDGSRVEMTRVRTEDKTNQHVTTSNDRSKPENKCRFDRFTSRDRFSPWKRIFIVHLSPVCGLFDQFLAGLTWSLHLTENEMSNARVHCPSCDIGRDLV